VREPAFKISTSKLNDRKWLVQLVDETSKVLRFQAEEAARALTTLFAKMKGPWREASCDPSRAEVWSAHGKRDDARRMGQRH
jgi:hypothetical protein